MHFSTDFSGWPKTEFLTFSDVYSEISDVLVGIRSYIFSAILEYTLPSAIKLLPLIVNFA